MTRPIRWGLLSTAQINRRMIPAIRSAAGHQLYGVASRTAERVEAYAAEWSINHAYARYEALLDDPNIDVVYISLPNHMHKEWCLRAAAAGKHVLCEKPLVLTPQDVDEIAAAAQQNHVVIMEAFMYRHAPRTLRVQEILRAGELGKIGHFYGQYSDILEFPNTFRWQPDTGGGSVWDIGCYPVSYARMVMGRNPVTVFAQAQWIATGVDYSMSGQLMYEDDTTAQVFSSFNLAYSISADIYGDRGALLNKSPYSPRAVNPLWMVKDGQPSKVITPLSSTYREQVLNMGAAVRGEAAQRISLAESRDICVVLCALVESAMKGVPVKLS